MRETVFGRDEFCLLYNTSEYEGEWNASLHRCGSYIWEWDIKEAWYWSPGTINMKPLHLSICCSAVCPPLKWVIMTWKRMVVCGCVCVLVIQASMGWGVLKLTLHAGLNVCLLFYCVFVAVADRSSNTDRMQAVPMRPCMLTAAGQDDEQLLIGFQ